MEGKNLGSEMSMELVAFMEGGMRELAFYRM